jgi:hypothetical protein
MNEMVERVARALLDSCRTGNITRVDGARLMARAAIEAMREPTTAMIEAEPPDDGEFSKGNSAAHAKAFWQAMIDEALK